MDPAEKQGLILFKGGIIMYKIVRRVFDVSDDSKEKILSESCHEYKDLSTAIFELEKARKADRAMYRLILNKNIKNSNYICDDWHNDISYMYRIHNTCIECELVDALKIALKIYRLED